MTAATQASPEQAAVAGAGGTAAKRGRLGHRRLLFRVSIQSKFLVMLLVSTILSAAVVGVIGYESGHSSLRASVFDRLTQVRESQTRAVESKIADLKNSAVIYTRGLTTIGAVEAYSAAFRELVNVPVSPNQQQALVGYYDDFVTHTEQATGARLNASALLPGTKAQKFLQANYTVTANGPDNSAWGAANAQYDDYFREIVDRFGYNDALLLDTAGNVVYSAKRASTSAPTS